MLLPVGIQALILFLNSQSTLTPDSSTTVPSIATSSTPNSRNIAPIMAIDLELFDKLQSGVFVLDPAIDKVLAKGFEYVGFVTVEPNLCPLLGKSTNGTWTIVDLVECNPAPPVQPSAASFGN
jgi:hypothetical protein